MELIKTDFFGLFVLKRRIFRDSRGIFSELFRQEQFEQLVPKTAFVQDNSSTSSKGVVRGLHYQLEPFSQGKLITSIRGNVFDVVLDLRADSRTYGKIFSLTLSDENGLSLYIPSGFAHGFQALTDGAILNYKCTNYHHTPSERVINPVDSELGIEWPLPIHGISEKDKCGEPWKSQVILGE